MSARLRAPMATRLSIEDMNARLRAPSPKRLSIDEMNAVLSGGAVEPMPAMATRGGRKQQTARARSTLADFPSPMSLPPPEAELEARRQASAAATKTQLPASHGRRVPQPTLGERFRANVEEGFQNTLAGQFASGIRGGERFARKAEQLDKVIRFAESQRSETALPLPATIDPQSGTPIDDPNQAAIDFIGRRFVGVPLDELRRERQEALAAHEPLRQAEMERQNVRRFRYETMPGSATPLEAGAAMAGQLAGGLPTPENVVPVARGANLLQTFTRGAAAAGLTNLLTDPLVQSSQIEMGTRKVFDPGQPFLGAAAGAFLGGTLNVTPEIAGSIARAVGTQIGKAADRVTNSDVWRAMRGWMQRPDRMPDELKIEPTFDRSGAVAEPATRAPQTYREHVVTPPPTAAAREPAYQGAVRGGPFALPPRKPEPPSPAPAPEVTSTISGAARLDPTPPAPRPAPTIPSGAKLGPPRFGPGDAGSLGKAVPTTQAGLVSILDRADARRFRPKANKAYREAAEEQRQAFLAQLDEAAAAAADSDAARIRQAAAAQAGQAHASPSLIDDYRKGFIRAATDETVPVPRVANAWAEGLKAGKAWRAANPKSAEPPHREVRLQTLRGRETIYRLANDPEVINDFRSRFTREADVEKFYSKAPGGSSGGPRRMSLAQMQQRATRAGTQQATTMHAAPGANYVGAAPQTYNPAVPLAKDPIRRESILREFVKGMGMPIYTGRIKSKKVLGFFRPRVGEVRIKRPNDIETAAHEMAHLLDRMVPEIRQQWHPATNANAAIRKELAGVSYDASKLYEGFAEFVRLWMTQKNQAQARAPRFFAWFENFVARSKYGPTLRRAQEQMLNWFEQAALDRGRSKIGPGDDINAGLAQPFDHFRQAVTDDLHAIAVMERTLTGGLSPLGAYETARLTRGKTAIIEGALTLGAPRVNADGSHSFVGKGLQQILDPVTYRLDDFLMYAVGRSASELMAQGRERLFTAAEIKGMLALDTPEFRQAFAEYQRWNKAIVDFAEAKGVIDPAFRANWKRTQYLPFYRVAQPAPGTHPQPSGDWRGIKALTGGSENLRPVLGSIIQNAAVLIDAALTNEARQAVARLAGKFGGARFMAKIGKETRAVRIARGEIERAILQALGVRNIKHLRPDMQAMVDQIVSGMAPMTALFQRGQTPKGGNVVAVLWGGKPTYYEVADPLIYRALTALNRKAAHWLIRALAIPKRIGQMTVTLTLDFMARNILRDTAMAGIMSRHGFRPFVDSAKGFKSRLVRDRTYREFISNGGGLGSHLLDETTYRKHLERFYTGKGINYRTVLDAPDKLLFGLERIAESFEQATRLGEFSKAIARGEHPRHAAYSAREVSTDFAMRGDSSVMGFFYDTVIFFKAAVNGMERMYRGFVEDPHRGTVAAKTAVLALMSAGLYAVNRGNPLYEQLEDWDRDTHWHFFIPRPDTYAAWAAGQPLPSIEERYWHFRLPKLWEIGAIGSIAERQVEGILNGQPGKAQIDTLRVIREQFDLLPIPQAVQPLAELAMNTDLFTMRPVESQADKELLPFARSDAYTSPTLRALGEDVVRHLPRGVQQHGLLGFPLSPKNVQHLLGGYFNGWAMYGMTLTDAAFFDDAPDLRLDQLPVLRSFYRQEPARQTKYANELFDAIDESTEVRRTMRAMDRRWRPEIADELEESTENALYGQLNRADQRMRVFRREMLDVAEAPDLASIRKMAEERAKATKNMRLLADTRRAGNDIGAIKRVLLDDLIRERNAFAEMVMKDVESRRSELQATGTQ